MMSEPPKDVSVAIKWQGKLFSVTLAADADVGSLKRLIEAETNVLPARQKLLNVKVGPKMADDAALLSTVKLPVVMMMGSTEAAITSISVAAEAAPDVLDDFDVRDDDPIDVKTTRERGKAATPDEKHEGVPPLNPPRDGKKLLVLDIDYTLFDHRSTAEHPLELMRPYLHEFLTRAYEHYDIAIWSATGSGWIELKMKGWASWPTPTTRSCSSWTRAR